ncbi:MAG: Glycosyl transferase family 2 [Candidatus Bathyarchaeota archaeon BA2]|nr:MAG: Glycosyl transferase family 2 [Candidatus Bathyarchaeota archaeon BA2]
MSSNVTLGILTLNEESLIEQCILYHHPFFREVLVLDGNSIDGTDEIAKELGAKVFYEDENLVSFAEKRNFLASKASTPWILFVDADELFDYNFLCNIGYYTSKRSEVRKKGVVAFRFPRAYIDDSHLIEFHVRLYKISECKWVREIHEILADMEANIPIDQIPNKCQTLNGHFIIHLHKSPQERYVQKMRWKMLEKEYNI